MNLLSLRKSLSTALLLVICYSASAQAAANVNITATGDKSYSVQGSGMDGVAAIELHIKYDEKSLVSPTATKGGLLTDAMFAPNTTTIPGMIKIAIISINPFSGSGEIAKISFERRIGTGGITLARVNMIDSKYAPVTTDDSSGQPSTPVTTDNGSGQSSTLVTPSGIAGQSSTPITPSGIAGQPNNGVTTSLGTVTFSPDQQHRAVSEPAPPTVAPVIPVEPAVAKTAELGRPSTESAAEVKPEDTPQYVVYKDIIDRFKQYDGSKKLTAVLALFDKRISQIIQQNPIIVISNGTDKGILAVDLPARITTAPNFAVDGGTLVSFHEEKLQKGRWMVEVLPEAGSLNVTVTIIAGAEEFNYPLTVAPPVKTTLTLDEKGWDTFLAETGSAKIPRHDFNNDGIRNYIDEYIFAANIIAKKAALETTSSPVPVPTKQPVKAPPKAGK